MEDFRLLIIAVLLLAIGCSREIDVPRIAGQLLDERTAEPIEGAALYMSFSGTNHLNIGGHGSAAAGNLDERVGVTNANGQFEFAAHSFRLRWFVSLMKQHPGFQIVHREYGKDVRFLSDDRTTWDQIVWRITPNARDVELIRSGLSMCEHPCGGLGRSGFPHCYELLCGEPLPNFRRLPEDRH